MVVSGLKEQLQNLRNGDHLCLFYEKEPPEQMAALVPFIEQGLSRDEQVIYIADDQTIGELACWLEQSGIEAARESQRGALKLRNRERMASGGRAKLGENLQQILQFADDAGKRGSRRSIR